MEEQPIIVAEFEKATLKKYWILGGVVISVCTIVGIPLMLIWVPIAMLVMDRWIDRLHAELTPTKLIIRKGYLVRVEKIVPLEKITDLALKQGPIMRFMNLEAISVETAGSSGGGEGGALVQLVGIKNTREFRKAVLEQRDAVAGGAAKGTVAPGESKGDVLERIYETLGRIEKALAKGDDGG
ncbi:MAG: PH domain-containing protein [Planctomycetota bacterium]|jgi:putative membrane protein